MSIRRLQKFMMYDEITSLDTNEKKDKKNPKETNDIKEDDRGDTKKGNMVNSNRIDEVDVEQIPYIEYCISIENGSTKWLDYEREDTLQDITIKVRPGELIAIVGQVGAGKSSLLNVMLRELRLREGSIQVRTLLLINIDLNKYT